MLTEGSQKADRRLVFPRNETLSLHPSRWLLVHTQATTCTVALANQQQADTLSATRHPRPGGSKKKVERGWKCRKHGMQHAAQVGWVDGWGGGK